MGEALALDAAWLFAAFLILLVLAASGIAVRRFLLERRGATVECGLRRTGRSWRLGVASYQLDEFRWYGIFGISMRAEQSFPRRDLSSVRRGNLYPIMAPDARPAAPELRHTMLGLTEAGAGSP